MASSHPAEPDVSQAVPEAIERVAEETNRAAQVAADAGEAAARAGAHVLRRNVETARDGWKSGSQVASRLTERSLDSFGRAFGITGEHAEQAAEQSSRNVKCIVQSGTIIADGMQTIFREMFEFARKQLEQNIRRVNSLANCRTSQEMVAAQSDLFRDNLEGCLQSTRRISEISMQMAGEAARRMSDLSLAPR